MSNPSSNQVATVKLSREARELIELAAKAHPLTQRQWTELTLDTARGYYDTQCEAMSRHLANAGNSAFEIGKTLYWVNERLGNNRNELTAWLMTSAHPRSISGAYQYIKLYREQDKIRAAGKVPEEISFKAARAIVTEPRGTLLPAARQARNKKEMKQLENQRANAVTRCVNLIEWIGQSGDPALIDELYATAKQFVQTVEQHRRRAAAVRKEDGD